MIRAIAVAILLLPGAAAAEAVRLLERGAWAVDHVEDESGPWCRARTENGEGQALSLVGYATGRGAILVSDEAWSIRPRPVRLKVDVDDTRWDMQGEGMDDHVFVFTDGVDPGRATRFLAQLGRGRTVEVLNDAGRPVAAFSLSGSGAAIVEMLACRSRIAVDPPAIIDPDAAAADPFR